MAKRGFLIETIGCDAIIEATITVMRFHGFDEIVIVNDLREAKQIQDPFKPEPMKITPLKELNLQPKKYYEHVGSKYIDKPKNNFKKR